VEEQCAGVTLIDVNAGSGGGRTRRSVGRRLLALGRMAVASRVKKAMAPGAWATLSGGLRRRQHMRLAARQRSSGRRSMDAALAEWINTTPRHIVLLVGITVAVESEQCRRGRMVMGIVEGPHMGTSVEGCGVREGNLATWASQAELALRWAGLLRWAEPGRFFSKYFQMFQLDNHDRSASGAPQISNLAGLQNISNRTKLFFDPTSKYL
jgi:hypothetical protein